MHPLLILTIGIVTVITLILALRLNAFIALIVAAIVVSVLSPGATPEKISRVAVAFGETAGKIGIVIGLAAVIGQCMMDSGAADRIVRFFLRLLGEKRASIALMGSGFVLSVPVFFDTVFYLLVPLARSLYKRTGKNYVMYIMAIAAGGAVTHTMVPPTPGPLVMASTLNVDLGVMIVIGAMIGLPAAIVGLIFSSVADRVLNIPMRPLPGKEEPEPLEDHQLPSLLMALLPVLLPVLLITSDTVAKTMAKSEVNARAATVAPAPQYIQDAASQASATLSSLDATVEAAEKTVKDAQKQVEEADEAGQERAAQKLAKAEANLQQAQEAREVASQAASELKAMLPPPIVPGFWEKMTAYTSVFGDANLALLLSTVIAMLVYYKQRNPSGQELASMVETSLMSGGVIILITAGGGAFGAMLKAAQIKEAIQGIFADSGGSEGLVLLFLGFGIASLLKVAQGSGTVSMITASSMVAAMITSPESLGFHPVYLATAIGAGSLMGSWMNDSGFWIFAKMGGLTEAEALKSWTLLLIVLGITSMTATVVAVFLLPLV